MSTNLEDIFDKDIVLGMYVDLDSLLDTRHALLYYLDPDLAEKLLTNGRYHNRNIDSFDYIYKSIFTTLYRNRNKQILQLATPSNILNLIRNYYVELALSSINTGGNSDITIYLNIYPYELTQEEIFLIETGLKLSINENVIIKTINEPPINITPQWVNGKIGTMFMYEGVSWIEYHVSTIDMVKTPLPEVMLIAPAMILGDDISLLKLINDYNTFFTSLEKSVEPFIKLEIVNTSHFCIMK